MGKQIIAVSVAVFLGIVVILAGVFLSSAIFPMPADVDPTNAEAMRIYVENVPIGGKLLVLGTWIAAAFSAGFIAQKMAPDGQGMSLAMIAGAVLLALGILNAISVPHPLWMAIIGLLQYIPMARIGAKVAD